MPLALALAVLLCAAPEEAAPTPDADLASPYSLPLDRFLLQAEADLALLQRNAEGLDRLAAQVAEHRSLYFQKKDHSYSLEQKRTLLTTWAAMLDYFFSTEVVRQRYWNFVKLPPRSQMHAWGFLLTHLALTLELAHGLAYAELAAGNPQLEVLLDELSPEYGVPPKAFMAFKLKAIHVSTSTQLLTGDAYTREAKKEFRRWKLMERPAVIGAVAAMQEHSKVAKKLLLKRGVKLFAGNAADLVKDSALEGFFPVQKAVAEWMGDTRVHRKNRPLVAREQVLGLLPRMEPGDVIVARQNWYLSNIGLPGFWPHAELYLSTPEEFATYFDADPEVRAFVSSLPERAESLSALLAARHPEKWALYKGQDSHGDPIRIMEAISEGVSLTGVEHGMRVDYVGVMRPRLSKAEKARAIVRAFGYQGLPYDFNFDFFSDSALVCTELVYKAYLPAENMRGLKLDLVDVAGRRTLPANEIVRAFDVEFDQPGRQLDFVAFLNGREDLKAAVELDAQAFRTTWRRLKWDIAQK